MASLLFGVETEYALASLSEKRELDREQLVRQLMGLANKQLAHLPDMNSSCGMFLSNASRFYLDCGLHPEIAGPECNDPRQAWRYVEAGHRIIENLIASLDPKSVHGAEVLCFRNNVDYSGTHATWGCHESYLHRLPMEQLQPQLIAFLVSRLVLAGAGGFNPQAGGLEFSLAPRMSYFQRLIAGSSTHERGIWHTKSESLCAGYGRLHILCGESLCSQTAGVLKIGATALAVALADAGFEPGSALQLADPLGALRLVARDTTCAEKLSLRDGSALTAIEIQRRYLEQAMAHLDDGVLPEWAGDVCRLWEATLDNLEAGNGAAAQTLDWRIKLALYANQARSLGIRWEDLPALNRAVEEADRALAEGTGSNQPASLESLLRAKNTLPKKLDAAEAQLESARLTWDDVRNLFENRKKLFEIDMRFGQLGPGGIFNTLDRAGVLSHRVDGVGDVEAAIAEPPASGRARIRGEVIRRLSGTPNARCDWQQIVQVDAGQVLDLTDPFVDQELWQPIASVDLDRARMFEMPGLVVSDFGSGETAHPDPFWQRSQAYSCYERGEYAAAEELLRGCVAEGFEPASTHCHLARVMVMLDREAEARAEIDLAWAARDNACGYVLPRVLFFQCLFAMLDGRGIADLVGQIKAMLNAQGAHLSWTILPVLNHLRSRLGRRNHRFLKALAAALSDSGELPALEQFPQWREAGIPANPAA